MRNLGLSEMMAMLAIPVVYLILAPVFFAIAVRIFLWFAEIMGIPDALGRFGWTMIGSYREQQAAKAK